MPLRVVVAFSLLCFPASAADSWTLARNGSFEVYSQSGPAPARAALEWLEQVRAFLLTQAKLQADGRPPLRVIAFRSPKEYGSYRLRPLADAYFMGTDTRDYIVLPSLAPAHFRVAAHEYVHAVLHAAGVKLPRWLDDGLAEVLSTVQFTGQGVLVGGDVPSHRQALRERGGIQLRMLLAQTEPGSSNRAQADLFYAQAWALTHMLLLSPDYGPRFPEFAAAVLAGSPGDSALTAVYRAPLETIDRALRSWVERRTAAPVRLPGAPPAVSDVATSEVTPFETRLLLNDLLLASGELERAERAFHDLEGEAPNSAAIAASLGVIGLRRGRNDLALKYFRRAIDLGVADASICYRFALLADLAGVEEAVVRSALERAIELKPDFDDARYKLALAEKNAGRLEAALAHFQAMRRVAPERAFAYWSATADALTQLGRRAEAVAAAGRAGQFASDPEERRRAADLAYIAETEMTVRFFRDAEGRLQLATTRAPRDAEWNPFIEPGDRIHRVEGKLVKIECDAGRLTLSVDTASTPLTLTIPDPSHVLMRNAPPEFTCGPQEANLVTVVYAAASGGGGDGVVRGVEFHPRNPR